MERPRVYEPHIFLRLLPEIQYKLMLEDLDYPSLLNLCSVSFEQARRERTSNALRTVLDICNDEVFWKQKTKLDFSSRFPEAGSAAPNHATQWREEYRYYWNQLGPALLEAAEDDAIAEVRELLDLGVNVNARDERGRTALHWASDNRHPDIVKMLIDTGADLEIQEDEDGNTAFALASFNGHSDIVRMLIDAGSDLYARDRYGRTALRWASIEGHSDIVRMLREAGVEE